MTVAAPLARSTHLGRERLARGSVIPRHRHQHGYIALVLAGGYREAGLSGRFELRAGDVAVHRSFETHLDCIGANGAEVLNLPLPPAVSLPDQFRINDPDLIARLAERDPYRAVEAFAPCDVVPAHDDWVDELAAFVRHDHAGNLRQWARAQGFAPETLSRGFGRAFGVTPARYRHEVRTQRAIGLLTDTCLSLAEIAADCGFADQPHLTRAITQVTGCPPGQWRRSIPFKTSRSC